MANKGLVECFLGLAMARKKRLGGMDDVEAQKALKTPNGKATYAQATARVEAGAWEGIKDKAADFMATATGSKPSDWLMFTGRPTQVLGEDFMAPMLQKLEDFANAGGDFGQYKAEIVPFLDDFLAKGKAALDPAKARYLEDLVIAEKQGKSLFPGEYRNREGQTPVGRVISNVIGRIVSNNPLIALYNVFEIMPKAYVVAMEQLGPGKAEAALFKTMADFAEATGGKFWLPSERIPSSVYQGIEGGLFSGWLKKNVGVGNLVDATENPLRTFSYLLGENIQAGYGSKAVEEIAFSFRPGNMPAMLRSQTGAEQVQLMRFSIRSIQMYGGLVKGALQGNPRSIAALIGFHALTAAQTGVKSTIPAPVWLAMSDDQKDALNEMQANSPNLAKLVGLDLADKLQPAGGVALSVGGSIATTAVESGVKKTLSAPAKIAEDPLVGGLQLLEGIASFAQISDKKVPINFNAPRILRAIRTAAENNELDFQGVSENIGETFGVVPKE